MEVLRKICLSQDSWSLVTEFNPQAPEYGTEMFNDSTTSFGKCRDRMAG
jgi:hypothetical protein